MAIASALRALLPTPDEAPRSLVCADVERLKAEHAELEPILSRIRMVADALPHMGGSAAKGALLSLNQSLADVLV
ncbi:hypothetical protein ABMY77_25035, partial [Escherichia coli]|uniref:hypothetical protein n=1 Tax=Escherichia coli TaxID=562 RepID=UPI0039BE3016